MALIFTMADMELDPLAQHNFMSVAHSKQVMWLFIPAVHVGELFSPGIRHILINKP